jgi:RNA polymerase sigma-70 factor (ECF subfamily)
MDKEAIYNDLLVLRSRRGDDSALEELVSRWETRLFYYVRRLVDNEDDAWDVLQETWLHVIRGIGSLREPRCLPAWLYRIARCNAMRRLRNRYDEQSVIEETEKSLETDMETEPSGFEDGEQVHYGLSRLSLPHREVLTLYFLQDLSTEEIAGILGTSVGTVKSRLHYAKRALRRILEQEAEKR